MHGLQLDICIYFNHSLYVWTRTKKFREKVGGAYAKSPVYLSEKSLCVDGPLRVSEESF